MPRRRLIPALLVALGLPLLSAGPARAHPHVFVTARASVLFDGAAVVGLRLDWLFDDFFSFTLLEDFDGDGDGRFDAAETRALHDNAFGNLRDHGWFTHIYFGGAAQPSPEPGGFEAVVEGALVRYRFDLMLAAPVDPAATRLEFAVYDQEYYVEMLLDAAAPVALLDAPPSCRVTVAEDEAHAYYFGLVYPQMIRLECGAR